MRTKEFLHRPLVAYVGPHELEMPEVSQPVEILLRPPSAQIINDHQRFFPVNHTARYIDAYKTRPADYNVFGHEFLSTVRYAMR